MNQILMMLLMGLITSSCLIHFRANASRVKRGTVNWNGQNWAFGCDWSGQDLSKANVKGEDCGGKCAATSGCTHFTWTNFEGGTCWMKSGSVSPNDAFTNGDNGMVCGYVQPNIGGSGGDCWETDSCQLDSWQVKGCAQYGRVEKSRRACDGGYYYTCCKSTGGGGSPPVAGEVKSGKTTRYWDCCKPSCGWNGKASVTSPVKCCAANGYSELGINEPSGCGSGGTAYTCSNNLPWVGDNDIAYGFAAAGLPGQSESNTCCACYELTFTSGPVNGKKMIVQVTNSGSDLGENHFDLQIPGGGVGIFNGCQSQWGSSVDGWGDRYGGVHSKEECEKVPEQIRAGCKWRFEWFGGADNPTMNFIPVSCPASLTSISGCQRQ